MKVSCKFGETRWSSFYPTALKGCWGIVFTHGVRMGGRVGGRPEIVCPVGSKGAVRWSIVFTHGVRMGGRAGGIWTLRSDGRAISRKP